MAIIRCDKGHYYDNTKFSQCPHCGVLPVMEKEKENGRNNHQPVVKTKAKSKSKLFSLFHVQSYVFLLLSKNCYTHCKVSQEIFLQ